MKRGAFALAAVILSAAGLAWGLGGEHPADQKVTGQKEWPAGLEALVNTEGRVAGYFVNANDTFGYRGKVEALNAFLEAYGKLKETPLKVTFHKRDGTMSLFGRKTVDIDWKLQILRRGWHPDAPESPAVDTKYVVGVEVYLADKFDREKIKVPKNVTAVEATKVDDKPSDAKKTDEKTTDEKSPVKK